MLGSKQLTPGYRLTAVICIFTGFFALAGAHADGVELHISLALADVLRAARTEIASQQSHINDPDIGDKGLTGDIILDSVLNRLREGSVIDAETLDPESLEGRLIRAQLDSIREVTNENQTLFNKKGVGFKGFVPAVFARLINERFGEKVGAEAEIKVTAPLQLVRNRKARPDKWERSVIDERFSAADWPEGKLYSEITEAKHGQAFRVMVPEYYGQACLTCHGSPAAELDITGHPKEGGELGDLGGSISITLYQ